MKAGLLKKISLALGLVLWVTGSVCASPADEEGANKANNNLVKVLVIGLHDNVESNYFPGSMITEETGIPTDSIDYTYNQIIAKNIIASNKNKKYSSLLRKRRWPSAVCWIKSDWKVKKRRGMRILVRWMIIGMNS